MEDIGSDSLMESEESDKDQKNKGSSRRAHADPAFGVADLDWGSYRSLSPLEHSGNYLVILQSIPRPGFRTLLASLL